MISGSIVVTIRPTKRTAATPRRNPKIRIRPKSNPRVMIKAKANNWFSISRLTKLIIARCAGNYSVMICGSRHTTFGGKRHIIQKSAPSQMWESALKNCFKLRQWRKCYLSPLRSAWRRARRFIPDMFAPLGKGPFGRAAPGPFPTLSIASIRAAKEATSFFL